MSKKAKGKSITICPNCGREFLDWGEVCPDCGTDFLKTPPYPKPLSRGEMIAVARQRFKDEGEVLSVRRIALGEWEVKVATAQGIAYWVFSRYAEWQKG